MNYTRPCTQPTKFPQWQGTSSQSVSNISLQHIVTSSSHIVFKIRPKYFVSRSTLWVKTFCTLRFPAFLPRDAMLARYMLWACVCLSVTSRCSTKTAEHRITQTTPHDSPGNLPVVFWCQRTPRNSIGVNPCGRQMQVGGLKSATFDK